MSSMWSLLFLELYCFFHISKAKIDIINHMDKILTSTKMCYIFKNDFYKEMFCIDRYFVFVLYSFYFLLKTKGFYLLRDKFISFHFYTEQN